MFTPTTLTTPTTPNLENFFIVKTIKARPSYYLINLLILPKI